MQRRQSYHSSTLADENANELMDELSDIYFPKEWKMVQNNPNCICLVRLEKWESNKIRPSSDIVVTRPANSANAVNGIKAHGCKRSGDCYKCQKVVLLYWNFTPIRRVPPSFCPIHKQYLQRFRTRNHS